MFNALAVVAVVAVVALVAEVADVALVAVEALPFKVAVIVPAEKLPEASRATIVEAPLAEAAFEVTVNVLLPDWSAVNVAEPDNPVPDTFIVNVPLFGADKATQAESPRKNVDALGVPVAAKLATGAVPLARAEAFRLVKLAPELAGNVAGKRASGTVPEAKAVAFKLVKFVPETAGNVAGNRASGTVPEERTEAFNAVNVEPSAMM